MNRVLCTVFNVGDFYTGLANSSCYGASTLEVLFYTEILAVMTLGKTVTT